MRASVQVGGLSALCFVCFLFRAVFVLTLPDREYGKIAAVASYLVVGEVVPLLTIMGAFYFLPMWWRSTLRSVDYSVTAAGFDEPAADDGLLSGRGATDDWLVVDDASAPSPVTPDAGSPSAPPSKPPPSYGALDA